MGMPAYTKFGAAAGNCPDCGKIRFTTRRAAKAYLRRRFPKQQMSAYPCTGGYFHVGHTPKRIRRGEDQR